MGKTYVYDISITVLLFSIGLCTNSTDEGKNEWAVSPADTKEQIRQTINDMIQRTYADAQCNEHNMFNRRSMVADG